MNLWSRQRALLMLFLFSDVGLDDLLAFYYDNQSLETIRQHTEAPVGIIKWRLHVARQRLRYERGMDGRLGAAPCRARAAGRNCSAFPGCPPLPHGTQGLAKPSSSTGGLEPWFLPPCLPHVHGCYHFPGTEPLHSGRRLTAAGVITQRPPQRS